MPPKRSVNISLIAWRGQVIYNMYLFIWGVDKTANLINNSISITDELQERVNSATFSLAGFSANYFEDIKIYEGFPVVSSTSTSVTLKKSYWSAIQNNVFRIGDIVTLDVSKNYEQTWTITDITPDSDLLKLTFSTLDSTPVVGNIVGKKRFAGNIIDIRDRNNAILQNIQFDITALDYTRIFDKKLINDTYSDRDSRYIVNDFCNTTVNKNIALDEFEYTNTTALRVVWTGTPSLESSDYKEGNSCMYKSFGLGVNSLVGTITTVDITEITWIQIAEEFQIVDEFGNNIVDEFGNLLSYTDYSVNGRLAFWYKVLETSSITVKFGTDSSNYLSHTFTPTEGEWIFFDVQVGDMTETGTIDYADITYIEIETTSTATSGVFIDWIRILESEFFRHYPYVQTSTSFDDFRVSRVKPTETMQRIADSLSWYWFVDYNKYIHLFNQTTIPAPIMITETSDNFSNLAISSDTSRLVNRQVVRGWEETSTSIYSQVVEGNSITREWITKNKFKNLTVKLNNGSVTDTMEASTNTTTVNATSHGLVVGDYIVNRTRSNAVREVLTVPTANQFTVSAVTSQTVWDSFSLFVSQTVGVEGLDVESSFDYMSNFNEKSIRSSETESTLISWYFLLFQYNEVIPIFVQRTDNVSVNLMKTTLGYTDGIFDWQPIIDQSLTSRGEVIKRAEAVINKYSNVIITATFTTQQEGLETGQLIHITDTTTSLRNIDQDFVIQSVRLKQLAWWENTYSVTCSSLLFGMLELLQQILATGRKIKVNEDETINNIEDANETLIITDSMATDIDGEISTETMIVSDSITNDVVEPPFYWWDTGGWPTEFQWELSAWD